MRRTARLQPKLDELDEHRNPSVMESLMPLRLTEARSGPRLGEAQRLWSNP